MMDTQTIIIIMIPMVITWFFLAGMSDGLREPTIFIAMNSPKTKKGQINISSVILK